MSKNYVTSFVPGKVGGGANVGTGLGNIKKGDILVVNAETSEVLTGGANTITTAPVIALAYCLQDGFPIISNPIYGKTLNAGGLNVYRAKQLQISALGYSATNTGASLPAAGSEEEVFSGAVVFPTDLRLVANRQDRIDFEAHSKGGYDLAAKLAVDINRDSDENPKLGKLGYVYAQVNTDGTPANIGTTATATVYTGSKKVTFANAHGLSAGDLVYFPNGGTYAVAAVPSTTVITLDYPYSGLSEVYPADTVKAMSAVTSWGISIYANEITYTNPVDEYNQISFTLGASENMLVTEEVVQAYDPGMGDGWEVRGKEIKCMGWMGYTDRNNTKRAEYPFGTSIAAKYNTVEMSSIAPVRGDMQQSFEGPTATFIAFDDAAETQRTAVMAILTPWAASGGIDLT